MQLRFNIAVGGIKTDGDNILAAAPGASNLEKKFCTTDLQTGFDSTELANIVSRYRNAFREISGAISGEISVTIVDDATWQSVTV